MHRRFGPSPQPAGRRIIGRTVHHALVLAGAAVLTLGFFLVLPLMQTLTRPPTADLSLQTIDTAQLQAPDPPPEIQEEKQPEPEDTPPELAEDVAPLDLSQLELALNASLGSGLTAGDFTVNLKGITSSNAKDVDALFSIADLDQAPRVIYQPGPRLTRDLRKRTPAKVYIVFIVDPQGKVTDPKVQTASDPAFEKSALSAVRQWKFEPGKRNGRAVRFRMRVPIVFPNG